MNKTRFAALTVGLTLAITAGFFGWNSSAKGQAQARGPQLEYRVVWSELEPDGISAEAITKSYNDLAKEGWEYQGPIVNGVVQPSRGRPGRFGVYVLFKRGK
jgi:hypothetical protein